MPYNPGVADRSGEILAGGINNTLAQFGQDMDLMRENERKRRTAAGQVQGILAANPHLAQKVDPTLLGKMSSGKAKLNDTLELLGTLSTVQQQQHEEAQQKLREVQMQAAQVQMQGAQQQQRRNAQTAPMQDQLQALRMESERQRQQKIAAEIEKLVNEKPFQPELRDLGNGVSAMMTSPNSAVPISRGAPAQKAGMGGIETIDVPGVGSIVIDKTTREPIPANRVVRPQEAKGPKLDPMMVGSLTQQIHKLEAEKLGHQNEIVNGDKRTGFFNVNSRAARLQEIETQLAGLKAHLGAGGKGGAVATPSAAAPEVAPVAAAQPAKGGPVATAKQPFYKASDVQAELRRRGLIQ